MIVVEIKIYYHQTWLKDPRVWDSLVPKDPRDHLDFRISRPQRMLAGLLSYPCFLLHSDPLDFALTDLGLSF
jgi:hypothetical protein